jgi:Txe/YoeB family toxin of Txe-Axe toxin-antitoxin module
MDNMNTEKILREKRINSLQRDITEITRINAKLPSQNQANFQRRINEKQELVNILIRQNNSNSK